MSDDDLNSGHMNVLLAEIEKLREQVNSKHSQEEGQQTKVELESLRQSLKKFQNE